MAKKIRASDYWRKREERQRTKNLTDQKEYDKHIKSIYQKAMDNIQKEIDSFYARYANKEGITLAEAKKKASRLDMEAYARKAKRYVEEKDFSKQANEEMRLYNLTMKVNRLELLKANIGLELTDSFNDLQQFYDQKLTDKTLAEFERQAGILGQTVTDTDAAKRAKVLVNSSFHNATWSDRIWMHQDLLKNELDKLLRTGLIQGRNPNVLARELRKAFDVSRHDAERLMRTEMARVQTAAQKDSFERNGYKEYEYICCGLPDACPVCRELDGSIFKVEDMMPGENAPPMHPNCHCSTAAAAADRKDFDAWLDAKAAGETDLGFEEWKQKSEELTERRKKRLADRNRISKPKEGEIQYDDRISEQQRSLLEDLSSRYNTRLRRVEIGAKKAAGDVDVSGTRMRLSDKHDNTTIHEFAHTLANTNADKFGLTQDQDFWKEIRKIRREYMKDVEGDPSRWISTYEHSGRSVDEFMAEAFTHAKMREMGLPIPEKYGNDFTHSQRVLDTVDKYFGKKTIVKNANSGIMKPDKIISGHNSTPKKADPNSIIDHLGKDGKTETRTFYNGDGEKEKDITNHNHGNPKQHPYGKHGEHAHDYEWNEDGSLKTRTTRDITDKERKENRDIL